MDTSDAAATVRLDLAVEGADAEDLEAATVSLRRQLADLDVDRVSRLSGDAAPEGAKSAELIQIGTLLVEVAKTSSELMPLLTVLAGWIGRRRRARLTVTLDGDTIELDSATAEQQGAVLQAFLARHSTESTA
jgi:hypothetical protein